MRKLFRYLVKGYYHDIEMRRACEFNEARIERLERFLLSVKSDDVEVKQEQFFINKMINQKEQERMAFLAATKPKFKINFE